MSLKLYSPHSIITAGTKVQVLLRFFDFNVQLERIPFAQWKSPEYLKKHPMGKVPTLETPEGCIFQSHSIMRYFARKAGKMYGSSAAQTASIDQWLEFINTQVGPNLSRVHYAILGFFPVTKQQYDAARKQLWESLRIVDGYLKNNKFLGVNEVSISDVSLATILRYCFRLIFDQKNRKNLPHLTKWFEQVSNLKQFLDHFGKLWLCQKEFVPEFAGSQPVPVQQPKTQQKKPKQQKKKQQSKKKEEPKKKEQSKKKEEKKQDLDDDQLFPKKKTNPLDNLPKSTFDPESFKRQICNTEDKLGSIKKLWATFDTEGWSLWRIHYVKYQGEGVVGYLTNNLKNGHLRNIDHFRKYCFGSYGIYGVQGNYEIDGIWIWRGTEIPMQWKEHQSYDYFTFAKMDPKNQADQKLAEQYWLNIKEGDTVQGKPVYDAEWFK